MPTHLQGRRRDPDPHHLSNLVSGCALAHDTPRGGHSRCPPKAPCNSNGSHGALPLPCGHRGPTPIGPAADWMCRRRIPALSSSPRCGISRKEATGVSSRGVGCFRSGAHGPEGCGVSISHPGTRLLAFFYRWTPGYGAGYLRAFFYSFVTLSGLSRGDQQSGTVSQFFSLSPTLPQIILPPPHCPHLTIKTALLFAHQLSSGTPRTIRYETTTFAIHLINHTIYTSDNVEAEDTELRGSVSEPTGLVPLAASEDTLRRQRQDAMRQGADADEEGWAAGHPDCKRHFPPFRTHSIAFKRDSI